MCGDPSFTSPLKNGARLDLHVFGGLNCSEPISFHVNLISGCAAIESGLVEDKYCGRFFPSAGGAWPMADVPHFRRYSAAAKYPRASVASCSLKYRCVVVKLLCPMSFINTMLAMLALANLLAKLCRNL